MVSVTPAQVSFTRQGTPFSETFGDVYFSEAGGLAQARHVFLGGNGLPGRWSGRDHFTILETGFGAGLNFLAAWDALRADPHRPKRLHFISVERNPFLHDDLLKVHAPWAELAPLVQGLGRAWPPPLAGFHRMHFDNGQVILTLLLGEARELLPQLEASVDAFFLDCLLYTSPSPRD